MTNLDNLARDIMGQFADWTDQVEKSVDDKVEQTAKSLRDDIEAHSPRKTGDYAKGWVVKPRRVGGQKKLVVYNKDHYRLTHLLEKGHAKRGGGRVAGIPHIAPAADRHIKDLVSGIQQIVRNGG